jgi:hypothetical protein
MEKIGYISDKKMKEGTNAETGKDWKMMSFKVDGVGLSTFNADLFTFNEGDKVRVVYEKDGKYNKLQDMQKSDGSFVSASEMDTGRDRRIVRQNCNERAIEFVTLMANKFPDKLNEVLKANGENLMNLVDTISAHFEEKVFR